MAAGRREAKVSARKSRILRSKGACSAFAFHDTSNGRDTSGFQNVPCRAHKWRKQAIARIDLRSSGEADRSEIEAVVHRVPEVLFAAEVSFRGLHRCMAEQELNLLNLASIGMAQLRAGAPHSAAGLCF